MLKKKILLIKKEFFKENSIYNPKIDLHNPFFLICLGLHLKNWVVKSNYWGVYKITVFQILLVKMKTEPKTDNRYDQKLSITKFKFCYFNPKSQIEITLTTNEIDNRKHPWQ